MVRPDPAMTEISLEAVTMSQLQKTAPSEHGSPRENLGHRCIHQDGCLNCHTHKVSSHENSNSNMNVLGKICARIFPGSRCVQNNNPILYETVGSMLSKLFSKLGGAVADFPLYFLFIPLLLTIILATGFSKLDINKDPEFMFSPTNGRARQERALFEHYFPVDFSKDFTPDRRIRNDRYIQLCITAKYGNNLINDALWNEIINLDRLVRTFEFYDKNMSLTYADVCAKNGGKCVGNNFLDFGDRMKEIEAKKFNLTFPMMLNPKSFENYVFPTFLAGVKLYPGNVIKSAEAMLLNYWGDSSTPEKDRLGGLWEKQFLKYYLQGLNSTNLNVALHYSRTVEDELEENTLSVVPYFTGTIVLMFLVTLVSISMGDCVRSKTWLGLAGMISSTLASATSFGLLLYCSVPFIGINLSAPFLMLGIGMDDTFVLAAAWQSTKFQNSVKERMSKTYADAAVSITITSLTSAISFFIGTLTPFASVQVFCLYLGTSVMVTYVWHITFFGACLALSGYAEKKQMHSIVCLKVMAVSQSQGKSRLYRWFCAGGVAPDNPDNPADNKQHSVMILFRDYVANCLNMSYVKGVVVMVFAVYISFAVYGCTVIGDGMEMRKMVRYDSYSLNFFNFVDKYFSSFGYRPMIMFTGNITYSDPSTEAAILDFIEKVESLPSIGDPLYTDCWVRQWSRFMAKNGKYQGLNNSNEETYIRNLKENFLGGETHSFRTDIVFNEDNTRIVASRCIVQAVNVMNAVRDRRLLEDLRQLADESRFNVTIFNSMFIFFDHLSMVRSTSLATVGLSAAVMVVIALIFIPNAICALWVGLAIVSIETGVVGYMGLWGVNFDVLSMIQLIMCVGFSVDFTAHISYAYLAAKADTPEERMRECLYLLGLPVMQGALSTLIGVLALILVPSYIFITFFKTVFLVIFFGAVHGLFFVPVFLSLFGPGSTFEKKLFKKS